MSQFDTGGADSSNDFETALAACNVVVQNTGRAQLILDSRNLYTLSTAPRAGANGQLAQVRLPQGVTQGIIEIVGMPAGDLVMAWTHTQTPGTVIRCSIASGSAPAYAVGTGLASMFGGPSSYTTAARSFNVLKYSFRDVVLQQVAIPPLCCIDAGWLNGLDCQNVVCQTDQFAAFDQTGLAGVSSASGQAHAIGVQFPFANTGFYSRVPSLAVLGYNCGIGVGENLQADLIVDWFNTFGLAADCSYHPNRINTLSDLANPYGICAYDPANPSVVQQPSATGKGSRVTASFASSLIIDDWDVQDNNGTPSWSTRLFDLLDTGGVLPISANFSRVKAGVGSVIGTAGAPAFVFNSPTHAFKTHVVDRFQSAGPITAPAVPLTTVAAKNPFARDAWVELVGTYTQVTVNGSGLGTPLFVLVPAQGDIALTYSGATPTWAWILA